MRRLLSTFALLVAIAAPAAAQDFFAQRTVYFAVTDCTTNHGGSTSVVICGGSAAPEGNVTGIAGRSIYFKTDGTIWMKAAGTGTDTSGWQGVTTPNVNVTSSAPYVRLTESDAGSDQKVWQWANGVGTFVLQALTDDLGTTTDVVSITRSNHDLTMANLAAGTGAVGGPSLSIGRNSSGSGAPGVLKLAQLDGDVSMLWIDSTGALRLGTSQPTEASGDTGGDVVALLDTSQTLTNKTLGSSTSVSAAIAWGDGVRQTFNPDGTNAGLNVGSQAGDPSAPSDGDLWYDSTGNNLRARINGATVSIGGGSSLSGLTAATSSNSIENGNLQQTWGFSLTGATHGLKLKQDNTASSTGAVLYVETGSGTTKGIYVNHLGTNSQDHFTVAQSGTALFAVTGSGARVRCSSSGGNIALQICSDANAGLQLTHNFLGTANLKIWSDNGGFHAGMGTTTNHKIYFYTNNGGTSSPNLIVQNDASKSTDIRPAGVRLTSDNDGALTFLGLGDGNDEDLKWNYDDGVGGANTVEVTSSTGVTRIDFTSINLNAAGFLVAGTAGVTVTSCTQFTLGICTAGTAPEMTTDQMIAEIKSLRQELAILRGLTFPKENR